MPARDEIQQRRYFPGRRGIAVFGALALAFAVVASGCGGDDAGGVPTLTWYINPDNGGQATLAKKCGEASGGAYKIETAILPNEADQQREQLVRRLAADDPSIDLMSLDPPFVAEFANAGYLLPITNPTDVSELTDGVLAAPLKAAYWDGQLVAPPFWANTQLLWYRKSVAQAAGVDPTAADFTWDAMIKAAVSDGKKIGVQGRRYEGYMVWINALIASGGGQIIENAELGADATPTVSSPAGDVAAQIVGELARSSAAPADMSTAGEEESRSLFQGDAGSFMVNWPYVYAAAEDAVKKGALAQSVVDDIGWARYPQAEAGKPSAPPLGGIDLAIGKFSHHPDQALEAVKCITSLQSNIEYMIQSGNPAARGAAFDDPGVRAKFPMADLIRESINEAGPRPITPYYGDVSVSVQRTWHPSEGVKAPQTPKETDSYMKDVLQGKRLL
jgi:multiple sugar transport system substrate-binding protein